MIGGLLLAGALNMHCKRHNKKADKRLRKIYDQRGWAIETGKHGVMPHTAYAKVYLNPRLAHEIPNIPRYSNGVPVTIVMHRP